MTESKNGDRITSTSTTWRHRAFDYWNTFSYVGLVSATLFFCASVTPSLIPRPYVAQGLLSGLALAVGYGVGVLLVWVYQFLQLPEPRNAVQSASKRITTVVVAVVFIVFLYEMTTWQNSIRALMEMESLKSAYPTRVALIAVSFAMVLVAVARLVRAIAVKITRLCQPFVPPRVAQLAGALLAVVLLVMVVNGVIARVLLDAADRASLAADRLIEEGVDQPVDPMATGSSQSLIAWDSIGRQGKNFVVLGPTQDAISAFRDQPSKRPIRVYAGIDSAETQEQRAKLALQELIRVGGFDRAILVVSTPTGTGWLDPAAVDTLEYLHAGDTAIVATQYSYLPSFLTIAVDPERSLRAARALFDAVYTYWKTLPKESRPKLYLQGLSLGALGSELAADLFTIFEDPIQGAVWSGPPFPSRRWSAITANRNPGTPYILPTFRDSSIVRFTAQKNSLTTGQRWSPIRCVYVQYASDPMCFFAPSLLFKRPDWLTEPRGPDVSPLLTWIPIVTALQVAFDMSLATTVPSGHGHNYSAQSYIDAWVAVTEPSNWAESDSVLLRTHLASLESASPMP